MLLSVFNIGLLVAVVALGGREAAGITWNYTDAANWAAHFYKCGGRQQSPINIKTHQVQTAFLDPILFFNYDMLFVKQTVTNDGHTIKVDISSTSNRPYIAWGGPWFYQRRKYNFFQYHFHWGSMSYQGSEHTINSGSYPMELHMVHFNDKYGDIATAVTKPDGLAVLGIFFVISPLDNLFLAPLISAIKEVVDYNTVPHYVDTYNLPSLGLLLPLNKLWFYRYDGSLTTPTCDESVLWTIFEKPIPISEAQMAVFRSVTGLDGSSSNNYRPTQPLNGREVYKSWL